MSKEKYNQLRDLFVGAILSIGVTFLGYLAFSVNELNKNVAVVIERQAWHDKAIQENKDAIRMLRDKVDN